MSSISGHYTLGSSVTAEMLDFFHKNGYIIVDNAVSASELHAIRADLSASDAAKKSTRAKDRIRHVMHKCFFEHSPATVDFILGSPLVDFVQNIIADVPGGRGNTLTAHLIHNNAFIVPPGGRGQAPSWHTDDALQNVILPEGARIPDNVRLPVMVCTCMIWLSDCMTAENGPTFVVPGSHRFGRPVDPAFADSHGIPACGRAGSAVIINSQLWHRGAHNSSNTPRETLQLTFGRRIIGHKFRSIMNYQMPGSVISKLTTDEQKARMGFLEGGAYS